MKITSRAIMSACIVGALCTCTARGDAFRIEDGKVVVDSPFDLEIGSPEYAKALGSAVKSHADARKDNKSGATVTNWYYFGEAQFSQPYFGAKNAWLSFARDDKALSSVMISIGQEETRFTGNQSFNECRKKFDEIVADMSKRLGEEIDANDDTTEEEAIESIEECVARGKKGSSFSVSFWNARAIATNMFGDSRALLGLDKVQTFVGKLGDLAIDIAYALPRYERRGEDFRLVRRGAVVLTILQSPIITPGKAQSIANQRSRP